MVKIMIVDDEPNIIELEKALLETEGYEVIEAHNGEEAIKLLKKNTPDLVILDMMMPGMSGREVCEKIRENPKTKNLKVFFITVARFSEIGKKELENLNVSDYITKPFDNEDVLNRIKKVLEQ